MANGFMENAAAFTEAFGVRHAPLVVWLSMVPWESPDERDNFIYTMTGVKRSAASTDTQR